MTKNFWIGFIVAALLTSPVWGFYVFGKIVWSFL